MNDFEKFLCFLVGVDEVHIKGGTVVCKFLKESSRYTVYAEAIAFIEEYNLCTTGDRKFLIDYIKKIYNYFNSVIMQANNKYSFENSLLFKYDSETNAIIQQLKKIIELNNY